MFSEWVTVFPTSKADAGAVAKALGGEIIPRWGISRKVSSDNEVEYLGIDMRTCCANHPANGGAVDRENGTLK